ncbi:hypothetical protein Zmor_014868 [Zophobas morio]|uniref:Uncharacterized protein n=1 Tax=Zophobas morio TaxID=2755281 RepID=A0AA38ID69_9CUCU|nr:hypothetical protein Zmor_014868 [Zophobas morio]
MHSWNSSFVFLLFIFTNNEVESKKNVWLRKFQMCDLDYDYPIKFESMSRIRNDLQYVNITATVNTPFGQDQSMNATFEYSPTGTGYMPLFKFTRSDLCDFFNKDLGPFWFELQRQIAVPHRSCPVPVGRYNVKNYQLPFNKLHMPLPTGFIRSLINIVGTSTNKMISCLSCLVEITNE